MTKGKPIDPDLKKKALSMHDQGVSIRSIADQLGLKYRTLWEWTKKIKEIRAKKTDEEIEKELTLEFEQLTKEAVESARMARKLATTPHQFTDVAKTMGQLAMNTAKVHGQIVDKSESTVKGDPIHDLMKSLYPDIGSMDRNVDKESD